MLCAKRKSDSKTAIAIDEPKGKGPYACPACESEVILRKGSIRVSHFAHKPPVTCTYGIGESDEHRRCKIAIFTALQTLPNVSKLQLERFLKTVRPDVSCYIGKTPVTIEVQISSLPLEVVIHRTAEYARLGIYLLWVSPWNPELESERYTPCVWEKWLHATYFGRVYYWRAASWLTPVHFEKHYLHVEEKSWYESGGNEVVVGGYDRTSKRYRTPRKGKDVFIARDFHPIEKEPWEGGGLKIPACRLWMDSQSLKKWD